MRIFRLLSVCVLIAAFSLCSIGAARAENPLDKWKPDFDYSGAKYKIKVSNVTTPALMGTQVGFAIRDELWKATNGQIYLEFLPFSMLGGEVEVLNQLQMGAIQGMGVSSVAATNLGPRMGVANLPFLINDFDKLDKFVSNEKLFNHFLAGMEHVGIVGLDITAYGQYGWATTTPVKSIADAKTVKFRTAEAVVNNKLYEAWGLPSVVMPWPDVPTALKQGVITGLDHTVTVCLLTKKFEVAHNYTPINYAQGLFIWIFNQAWLESLPEDLRATFVRVVKEQCAKYRQMDKEQNDKSITDAKAAGVQFWELSAADLETLRKEGNVVHEYFAEEIGPDYLKEVQDYLGYKN